MSDAEQRKLVDDHMSLVRAIAAKARKQLASTIELDDLVSYGTQGLLEAAQRFDKKYKVVFSTFAYYRIRGAIYDGLRKMGHLPRTEYARLQMAQKAHNYLQNLSDREAGAQDVPPGKRTKEDELREMYEAMRNVATVFVVSMEGLHAEGHEFAGEQRSPEDAAAMRNAGDKVREALVKLPAKERHFIQKHYFEDKTLLDAGKELGLSKSWSSRLHARAVAMLRQELADS